MSSNADKIMSRIKGKELRYYMPVSTQYITYSVDLVKLRLALTIKLINEIRKNVYIVQIMSKKLKYKESHRYDETYLYIYEAKYGIKEGYMRVEIRYNPNSDVASCTIECNPNKCFSFCDCLSDIGMLINHSIQYYVDSMDVAMDIPAHMRNVMVKKDKRSMTRYCRRRENETIYLGKRNKVNNVRVYDKRNESDLSYDLTRIELKVGNPLGFNFMELTKNALPQVYVHTTGNYNEEIVNTSFSSTDRVLIMSLRDHHEKIKLLHELDRKKTKKILPYVLANTVKIDFDVEKINEVAFRILNDLEFENSVIVDDKYAVLH